MNTVSKFLCLGLVFFVSSVLIVYNFQDTVNEIVKDNPVERWVKIAEVRLDALGENDPGSGASGWLASFILDWAETPGDCLLSNATDGSYDDWTNVSGYVDTDDTATNLKSEDPGYIVVRCRFNTSVASGGVFNAGRCRCNLTVGGDETINDVSIDGDDTDLAGGGRAVISHNESDETYIYINFVWSDEVDGYRITDDGELTWSITIWAKY